jgi:tetratricopeptide (TPR) repeat protein
MAPEQHARRGADALSDQFSFAVALWEALYGVRPYAANELPAVWRLQEPPAQARVAPWLRRVLQRALRLAPSERYPDMAALLAALREESARARSFRLRLAAGATAALVAVAVAAAWGSARTARLCTGAAAQVAAVWNPGRIGLLRAAFLSTPAPAALATWELSRRGLDAWFTAWAAQHTEACQATALRGEQSEAVLDLRRACLARRHAEANALLGVLQAASAEGLARAPEAVDALLPPSACSDVEVLRAQARPRDAQARALLDEAKARFDTGGYAEALERTSAAVARAKSLDDGPALASALLLRGRLEEHTGDLKAAEPTLLDAFAKAEASRDDATAGEAATLLSLVLGSRQARYAEAHSWLKLAEGTIGRAGNSASLQARLLQAQGLVAYAEGHLAEAMLAHQRAVALFRKAEPDSLALADALNALGAALRGGRRATEALEAFDGALKLLLGKVGEDSDLVATTRNGMASALMLEGRFDEAATLYQQALATFTQRLGPTHFRTVTTANNVGVVLAEQGRYAEALPWFAKVLAAREATLLPTDAKTADAHANLGMLLVELGRDDEALAHFAQARRILQGYPLDHFSQAESLLGVARVQLARGKGALAKEPLGQVLALCEGKEGFRFDYTRARANFLLGRALAEGAPRKPAEGKALALGARAALVGFGPERFKRDIGEVDRWLAAHP